MKKCIIFILTLICVFNLTGCSETNMTFDIQNASKIVLRSGNNGTMAEITDPEDIQYITDSINALKFSREDKVNSDGWTYSLCWYDESGSVLEELTLMGDGCTVIYDGYYYKGMAVDYEIDLVFLDDQFTK